MKVIESIRDKTEMIETETLAAELMESERKCMRQELMLRGLRENLVNSFCVMQTSLEAINGCVVEKLSPADQPKARRLLESVQGQMSFLQRLAQNMLHSMSGRDEFAKTGIYPICLDRELNRICSLTERELNRRSRSGRLVIGEAPVSPIYVQGDCVLVDSLFANLVQMMLEYSGQDSRIDLSMETKEEKVFLRIAGEKAIPPQLCRALQEQNESLFLALSGTTGISLYTAYSCCQAMGWQLYPLADGSLCVSMARLAAEQAENIRLRSTKPGDGSQDCYTEELSILLSV